MNELSEILLQGGRGGNESHLKGVFHRQFLPATNVYIFSAAILKSKIILFLEFLRFSGFCLFVYGITIN